MAVHMFDAGTLAGAGLELNLDGAGIVTEVRLGATPSRPTAGAAMAGFRLGSVSGIEIRIDISWFVIFFLVLWTLTRGVFPASVPGQSPAVYVAMGLAGALLLFASLLAHEMAHSLVARRLGLAVGGITLFIFGGFARAAAEFRSPREEFIVAAAGPLSSFAIAALFQIVALAVTAAGMPPAIAAVAAYLALINLVLAVFNLFPGFPLDGGRILRSVVWHRTRDVLRATRVATNGGRLFGFMLILLGIVNLFSGNPVGGLWLVLIGWFVLAAAEGSYAQQALRHSLRDVRVQDAMTPHPHSVPPDLPLQQFIEAHVLDGLHHSYPVMRNGTPVGLITLSLVRAVPRAHWSGRTVADAMVRVGPDNIVAPEDELPAALEKLARSVVGRVLVMHGGRLLGILSHTDVSRCVEKERLRAQLHLVDV
jgi:Zn-dependent protease/predicted transcriptional regulator